MLRFLKQWNWVGMLRFIHSKAFSCASTALWAVNGVSRADCQLGYAVVLTDSHHKVVGRLGMHSRQIRVVLLQPVEHLSRGGFRKELQAALHKIAVGIKDARTFRVHLQVFLERVRFHVKKLLDSPEV